MITKVAAERATFKSEVNQCEKDEVGRVSTREHFPWIIWGSLVCIENYSHITINLNSSGSYVYFTLFCSTVHSLGKLFIWIEITSTVFYSTSVGSCTFVWNNPASAHGSSTIMLVVYQQDEDLRVVDFF